MATEFLPFGAVTPLEDLSFFDGLLGELEPLALLPVVAFSCLGDFFIEEELPEPVLRFIESRLPDMSLHEVCMLPLLFIQEAQKCFQITIRDEKPMMRVAARIEEVKLAHTFSFKRISLVLVRVS